jgi:hypothetical protein
MSGRRKKREEGERPRKGREERRGRDYCARDGPETGRLGEQNQAA